MSLQSHCGQYEFILNLLWKEKGNKNYEIQSFSRNGVDDIDYIMLHDKIQNRKLKGKVLSSFCEGEIIHWRFLHHHSILPLLDIISIDENTSILIHPYLPTTFRAIIHEKEFIQDPNCFDRKKAFIEDVLWGLDYLHRKSLCLMNLNDAKILICHESNKAVISDFSAVTLTHKACKCNVHFLPFYRPPELNSREASNSFNAISADMWALGVMSLEVFLQHKIPWGLVDYDASRVMEIVNDLDLSTLKAANVRSNLTLTDLSELKCFMHLLLEIDPEKRSSAREVATTKFIQRIKTGAVELPYWETDSVYSIKQDSLSSAYRTPSNNSSVHAKKKQDTQMNALNNRCASRRRVRVPMDSTSTDSDNEYSTPSSTLSSNESRGYLLKKTVILESPTKQNSHLPNAYPNSIDQTTRNTELVRSNKSDTSTTSKGKQVENKKEILPQLKARTAIKNVDVPFVKQSGEECIENEHFHHGFKASITDSRLHPKIIYKTFPRFANTAKSEFGQVPCRESNGLKKSKSASLPGSENFGLPNDSREKYATNSNKSVPQIKDFGLKKQKHTFRKLPSESSIITSTPQYLPSHKAPEKTLRKIFNTVLIPNETAITAKQIEDYLNHMKNLPKTETLSQIPVEAKQTHTAKSCKNIDAEDVESWKNNCPLKHLNDSKKTYKIKRNLKMDVKAHIVRRNKPYCPEEHKAKLPESKTNVPQTVFISNKHSTELRDKVVEGYEPFNSYYLHTSTKTQQATQTGPSLNESCDLAPQKHAATNLKKSNCGRRYSYEMAITGSPSLLAKGTDNTLSTPEGFCPMRHSISQFHKASMEQMPPKNSGANAVRQIKHETTTTVSVSKKTVPKSKFSATSTTALFSEDNYKEAARKKPFKKAVLKCFCIKPAK